MGLPLEATAVGATISLGGAAYRVEADTASFSGQLIAESVPYGDASITVQALTDTGILERGTQAKIGSALTVVAVDFSGSIPNGTDGGTGTDDGGGVEPRPVDSNPIPHVIRSLRGSSISGGVLAGEEDANQDDLYRNNVEAMTSVLGAAPAAIVVRSVSIQLIGRANGVTVLGDLWSGRVAVSLQRKDGGGAAVEVASVASVAGTGAGPVSLMVTADRTALAPLAAELLSGDFEVRVAGMTALGEGDNFEADVRVTIIYSGFAS